MARAGFELTRKLPCDADEALRVLAEVRGWLVFRARLHLVVALVMAAASLAAGLAIGGPLLAMGLATALALAVIGLWAWRGSMGLARDAEGLEARIRAGGLEAYCGVSVLVALAKYRMEEERVASQGKGLWGGA